MTDDRPDTAQTEHEKRVEEIERERGKQFETEEGQPPTSGEDLAADRTDEDVVGDDQSSPGQNSDRLPQ